tara:strand:- start:872 stop:1264 length:393 start_codon:yes stop_codon:yes gene_type:complete
MLTTWSRLDTEQSPPFRRPRKQRKTDEKEEDNVLKNVPKGKGLLYDSEKSQIVDGPFNDLKRLYELTECDMIQMVPCTVGNLSSVAVLIMDEEGMYTKQKNEFAMKHIGEQVHGGHLHGKILVLHAEDFQ